jgi:hypothetical protein
VDPGTGEADFVGYRIYSSEVHITGPWNLIADIPKDDPNLVENGDRVTYRLEAEAGVSQRFAVTSYDSQGLESGKTAYTFDPIAAPVAPINKDMAKIRVVPNPFRQKSGLLNSSLNNLIIFRNIPAKCTLRIYTFAGELVKEIEHDGFGQTQWGSVSDGNLMLTDFSEQVQPGLYFYHVENQTAGNEGETFIGKFMVIR